MLTRLAGVGLVVLAWAWPASSEACSCVPGSPKLSTNLRQAHQHAGVIYYGRILSIEAGAHRDRASVEVLEVFKGKLEVGTKLWLPHGGDGDCSLMFKTGESYLMYAEDEPESVGMCSRTRPASRDDPELEWLRTGKLPVIPVAVPREVVTCQPCSLATVTQSLVRPPAGDSSHRQALAALQKARSFWTTRAVEPSNTGQLRAVGLSSSLRAFELIQTPYRGTRETCRQRVVRRWCEGLEPSGGQAGSAPVLRCVNPGPEEEVCNETKSRSARWGPLEAMSAASCNWYAPANPDCYLPKQLRPIAIWAPRAPLMQCSPPLDGEAYGCHVPQSQKGAR